MLKVDSIFVFQESQKRQQNYFPKLSWHYKTYFCLFVRKWGKTPHCLFLLYQVETFKL